MKFSIFIILTISIQNAMAKPQTPSSLWDLAITKSHHSTPEPKSERPKFPGNFIPVPSLPISYSRHDDTLAKPTVILDKPCNCETFKDVCAQKQSLMIWNEKNKTIHFSMEIFFNGKKFFCFI